MPIDMKNMIADTFFELAKEKSVDKITVKDLVENCNISRQTFYYHFRDIIEVVEWSAQKKLQQVVSKSLEAESPEEAIHIFVTMAVDNYDVIQKLLHSHKSDQTQKMFVHGVREYLEALIRNRAPDIPINYSDAEVALQFYSSGIAGLLLEYCGNRNINADKLSAQLSHLLLGSYFEKI